MRTKVQKNKRIERGRIVRELITLFKNVSDIAEPLFQNKAKKVLELLGVSEKSYHLKSYLDSRLKSLVDGGYIVRQSGKLVLTGKGDIKLKLFENGKIRNRLWDGRWRVVMFDVYESRRNIRDKFRSQLKEYGFVQLQRSVWIYPYECEEFAMLIKTDNNFGKNVRYGVLEALEGDANLRKLFKL